MKLAARILPAFCPHLWIVHLIIFRPDGVLPNDILPNVRTPIEYVMPANINNYTNSIVYFIRHSLAPPYYYSNEFARKSTSHMRYLQIPFRNAPSTIYHRQMVFHNCSRSAKDQKRHYRYTVSTARWPAQLQDKNDLFSPIYDHTLPNTSRQQPYLHILYVIIMQPSNGFSLCSIEPPISWSLEKLFLAQSSMWAIVSVPNLTRWRRRGCWQVLGQSVIWCFAKARRFIRIHGRQRTWRSNFPGRVIATVVAYAYRNHLWIPSHHDHPIFHRHHHEPRRSWWSPVVIID